MSEAASLSVSIVTYHGDFSELSETVESLRAAACVAWRRAGLTTTVYLVSNDTEPVATAAVQSLFDALRATQPAHVTYELIAGQGNIGFGAGHNLALERTDSNFHLILNPDVLLDEGALQASVAFLKTHPDAVMSVPQAYDARGDYACLAKREPTALVLLLRGLTVRPSAGPLGRLVGRYVYADRLPSPDPFPVLHASGCFMLCRTRALKDIGGFDEGFFLYFEDYDLSRRIARHGGIYELPDVHIRHMGGFTAQQGWLRILRFLRSASTYFQRYGWRLF